VEEPFSQRMGLTPVRRVIQVDSIDDELRNLLWNDFIQQVVKYKYHLINLLIMSDTIFRYNLVKFVNDLWFNFFKKTEERSLSIDSFIDTHVKYAYQSLLWYRVYDFIEFIANRFPSERTSNNFVLACNSTLERELSAYRFVGKRIVPITSKEEIAEVEEALSITKQFTPHLDRALDLLANKKSPDYANSIKESISAVEAICQLITGNKKPTLGEGLRQLESRLGGLHPALRNAFNSLYGYTSDAQGIRHALLGESNLDVEDAKFMLISCSAFIDYLFAKARKAGIELTHK
jgi:hypothetical protein